MDGHADHTTSRLEILVVLGANGNACSRNGNSLSIISKWKTWASSLFDVAENARKARHTAFVTSGNCDSTFQLRQLTLVIQAALKKAPYPDHEELGRHILESSGSQSITVRHSRHGICADPGHELIIVNMAGVWA